MRKLRILRPLLLFGLALTLFATFITAEVAINSGATWAAPLAQTNPTGAADGNKPAGSEYVTPASSYILPIILITVVFALIAVGLGFVVLRLTRDSG